VRVLHEESEERRLHVQALAELRPDHPPAVFPRLCLFCAGESRR
jgi:hypothetical protein